MRAARYYHGMVNRRSFASVEDLHAGLTSALKPVMSCLLLNFAMVQAT